MTHSVGFWLSILGWIVMIVRLRAILQGGDWKSKPVTIQVWFAMFFFTLSVTFLVDPVRMAFDRLTWNSFSRLLAFSSSLFSLYCFTTASIHVIPTTFGLRIYPLLKPFIVFMLGLLTLIYILWYPKNLPWVEISVPKSIPEAGLMLATFASSLVLCVILYLTLNHLARVEQVEITKTRATAASVAMGIVGIYYLLKILMIGGYFWHPLGSETIANLTDFLLLLAAIIYGAVFIHNQIYLTIYRLWKPLKEWTYYKELEKIIIPVDDLGLNFPPWQKPGLVTFLTNSEYCLYQAVIHLLDGKVLLSDFLTKSNPNELAQWVTPGRLLKAKALDQMLKSVSPADDFWSFVQEYSMAGKSSHTKIRSQNLQDRVPHGYSSK
ncbi:MAG: hypothetical protein PHQ40_08625 [Anaerolineaceae bacterium]|nr:hypothetical protein [Anaerolineaceae bacterium]